jgi:flagellar FliL protein
VSAAAKANMADKEQTPPDPAAKPAKKKGGKGKLLIILVVLVLLLGGGGAAAFFAFRKPAEAATGDAAKKKETKAPTGIVSFEPFVVNLADPGAQHFLRISVRLIVATEEEAKKIDESQVQLMRLRSAVVDLLTSETSEHIVSAEGKSALKKEIAERAAKIIEPIEVADVLFSDFVVQY